MDSVLLQSPPSSVHLNEQVSQVTFCITSKQYRLLCRPVTHSVITLQHDSVLQLNEQVSQHTFSHHTKQSLLHTACHTRERGAYYKVLPRSQDTFCHHNLQHDSVLQSRVDLNQQDTFIITFSMPQHATPVKRRPLPWTAYYRVLPRV